MLIFLYHIIICGLAATAFRAVARAASPTTSSDPSRSPFQDIPSWMYKCMVFFNVLNVGSLLGCDCAAYFFNVTWVTRISLLMLALTLFGVLCVLIYSTWSVWHHPAD